MILTFKNSIAKAIFEGRFIKGFPNELARVAARKLEQINVVNAVMELRVPPGNRLEALAGDRKGQFSIRINEQWRVCFKFSDGNARDVEIVDYH